MQNKFVVQKKSYFRVGVLPQSYSVLKSSVLKLIYVRLKKTTQ